MGHESYIQCDSRILRQTNSRHQRVWFNLSHLKALTVSISSCPIFKWLIQVTALWPMVAAMPLPGSRLWVSRTVFTVGIRLIPYLMSELTMKRCKFRLSAKGFRLWNSNFSHYSDQPRRSRATNQSNFIQNMTAIKWAAINPDGQTLMGLKLVQTWMIIKCNAGLCLLLAFNMLIFLFHLRTLGRERERE